MRYYVATVLCATIFGSMCISSEVFGSDLYCFSCFGYDEDGHAKCHSRQGGELFARKCTGNNSTRERPVCIRFTASFKVNQWIRDKLVNVPTQVHGLHCGMRQENPTQCNKGKCPNFWQKDVLIESCDVSCCDGSDKNCNFPLPIQDDIDRYNERNKIIPVKPGVDANGQAVAGRRSGMGARIVGSVWLQTVSFAIFGWFNRDARDF